MQSSCSRAKELLAGSHGFQRIVSTHEISANLEHLLVKFFSLCEILNADPNSYLKTFAVASIYNVFVYVVCRNINAISEACVDFGLRQGLVLIVVKVDDVEAGRGTIDLGHSAAIDSLSHLIHLFQDILIERGNKEAAVVVVLVHQFIDQVGSKLA